MALFTHLPGAGGELKQVEDCDGDCTRIYGPPGRLLPPYEGHTRGQLTAAGSFGFSFRQSPGGKFYATGASQTLVFSQGCPVSIVRPPFLCKSAVRPDV